jgi:hypothetical protein
VQFTVLSPGGFVQEGTAIAFLTEIDGDSVQYSFFVRETAYASGSSTTVNAVLESIVVGPLPVIPIGTPLTIAQPSSEILTCVTTSTPSVVESAETDVEYLSRGVTYLNSLSASLCTSAQIEAFILSTFTGVTRCRVYDLAYGSATSPVATTTTVITEDTTIDVEIDCSDERSGMFAFNDSLSLDIDGQDVWITTQAAFGDETITSEVFPSGLVSISEGETTVFDLANQTINLGALPVAAAEAVPAAGETMVQLVSGLTYSVLSGTPPASRTPDSRGMYVIFVWGQEGKPVQFDVINSIYDELSNRTPVGFDAFIHQVMPVEIYCLIEVEILDGFVGSSVIAEVKDSVDLKFSPNNYPNWNDYLYVNEIVVHAASVVGVKRVVSVDCTIPGYGEGDLTSATGSDYLNNTLMASVDSPTNTAYIEFVHAGSMPKITSNVSIYGT